MNFRFNIPGFRIDLYLFLPYRLSYSFQLPSKMTPPERLQFRKFLEEWNPKLIKVKNLSVVFKPKYKSGQNTQKPQKGLEKQKPILQNMLAAQNFNPKIPHHLQARLIFGLNPINSVKIKKKTSLLRK